MKPIPDLNIQYLSSGRGFGDVRHRGAVRRLPVFRRSTATSNLLWNITDTSSDVEVRATVGVGVLLVSEWQSIAVDGSWSGARVLKRVDTLTAENVVSDGDSLWLKIEFVMSDGNSYRAQFQAIDDSIPTSYNTASANGPDPHIHAITLKTGSANDLAAQLLTTYKQYATHSWVVVPSGDPDPTDTGDEVYVKFATFAVDANDNLSITQYIVGCPITVPLVAVTWGDGIGD